MRAQQIWTWPLVGLIVFLTGCGTKEQPTVTTTTTATTTTAHTAHPEVWPAIESPIPQDPEVEQAVSDLLAQMTLEEKIGQVIQAEIRYTTPDDVRKYRLGSVLNGGGAWPGNDKHAKPEDWLALADAYWEASMDTSGGGKAIPIIWGSDAVHGHTNVIGATVFPHNIGLGATKNPALLRQIGEITAREVAATGLDWTFGPTVTAPRDDRWGRTYEGYSEDPEIISAYAEQIVAGLQGEGGDFLDGHHILSTAKHFLGDGGTDRGVDQGDTLASEKELRDIHGAGYAAALGAGVQTVMASFNSWHGEKMHGRGDLLTDVLKGQMGFDGFVVGDWNGHGQVEGCSNESCAASFNAGVDMFMVPEDWKALYENTLAQARSGEIPAERLDDAVRRILRVKMRAGLFDFVKPSERPLAGKTELLGAPEHRTVARQAVRESLVLLKNNGGLLPLARGLQVLVAGNGADNLGKQAGGWTITWQGTGNKKSDFPGGTSIWDGIREAVEGAGGHAVLSEDGSFATKPDVAIVVYGEDPYAEFQGDRDVLEYQDAFPGDLKLLRRLKAADVPVVSIFLSGRPMWVNPELNASDAFVAAWLPGSEGAGIADVIFRAADGAVAHDFRGRLSYSWPKSVAQTVLNRGDADYDPLFPYGFGLTYADGGDLAELSEVVDAVEVASTKVYFEGGPVPPWQLYVGAAAQVEATANQTATGDSEVVLTAIDRQVQEDARSAHWSGKGFAQVYLLGDEAVDIRRESNGNLALGVDLLIEEAPSSPVTLRMGCNSFEVEGSENCSGDLDVTEVLRGLPTGEWQPLRVRLRCFEEAGADMSQIRAPFLLATEGAMAVSFGNVKLVTEGEGEVTCP